MKIKSFYDERTSTLSYVVWDEATRDAIVIDPVLDYDPVGSRVWQESVQRLVDYIERHELRLYFILETHAHADHLSGSQALKRHRPTAKVGISHRITEVQEVFGPVFESQIAVDGSQFDLLLQDNQRLHAGSLSILAVPTPGHTPACISYLINDAIFTGDTILMPDVGTGRCDFPKGSAKHLFQSVSEVLYRLPDATRVFVGHDYPPVERAVCGESNVGQQKANNIHLQAKTSEAEFLEFRDARDIGLSPPTLLYPSIQVNIDAGHLPSTKSGKLMLKIPLNEEQV